MMAFARMPKFMGSVIIFVSDGGIRVNTATIGGGK